MTEQEVCSAIAQHEAKKVEVSIGNIREVVRIIIEEGYVLDLFLVYLTRFFKRKKNAKNKSC